MISRTEGQTDLQVFLTALADVAQQNGDVRGAIGNAVPVPAVVLRVEDGAGGAVIFERKLDKSEVEK